VLPRNAGDTSTLRNTSNTRRHKHAGRRAAEEQRSTHDVRVLFGHVTVHSREVRRAPLFAPIGKQSVVNVQATCTT